MFKACLGNRCLIPTGAFFECATEPGPDGKKVEYEFRPTDRRVLWIAGPWENLGAIRRAGGDLCHGHDLSRPRRAFYRPPALPDLLGVRAHDGLAISDERYPGLHRAACRRHVQV